MSEQKPSQSSLEALERQRLYRLLRELPSAQFEELLFVANPPSGIVSGIQSQQGIRTKELLSWAESTGGCGLDNIWTLLKELIPDLVIPPGSRTGSKLNVFNTGNPDTALKANSKEFSELSEEFIGQRSQVLLIGVSEYGRGFTPLPSAQNDLNAMHSIFSDDRLGDFSVKSLINPNPETLKRGIIDFSKQANSQDLNVFYFSGHAIREQSGELFLATKTTCRDLDGNLDKNTVVSSSWLKTILDQTISRQQILILDCCFSGALAENLIAKGSQEIMYASNRLVGEKRVVLASSASSEESFHKPGMHLSLYTNFLVEGIFNHDKSDAGGHTSVVDLHQHIINRFKDFVPIMTPQMLSDDSSSHIKIFRGINRDTLLLNTNLSDLYSKVVCEVELKVAPYSVFSDAQKIYVQKKEHPRKLNLVKVSMALTILATSVFVIHDLDKTRRQREMYDLV